MLNIEDKKILFISGHTDDVELACGATLAKCIRLGADVYYLALTSTDNYIDLEREATESMKILGVSKGKYWFLSHTNMAFPDERQKILWDVEKFRDSIEPDLVLCPSFNDMHQDHSQTTWEVMRCFKRTAGMIWGYDICWNTIVKPFDPKYYVQVIVKDVEKKLDAIKCYKSQINKGYMSERLQEAQLIVNAGKSGLIIDPDKLSYAEAFEVYRGMWW